MSTRDPLGIAGQIIADKYRIERLVGEGGFAVVYRAEHTIWQKPVAIKFFNGLSNAPTDQRAQFREAFIQEGALLTELSSQTAAIVQARDVGTYTSPDGHWMPYMVLEWLEGRALDEVLDAERTSGAPLLTLAQVLPLLGQAAAALDVAHGKGIAHRDIKPANLFVLGGDVRAPNATLKVLDFGVAKMMSDNTQLKAALAKTGMGVTSFTPQYGAPEQFNRSYGATGPWTDVYALALVAVEMLTGRNALDGDDIIQLAVSSSNPSARPTPRALGAVVPEAVEEVFQRALAVQPSERYARAREFWGALEFAFTGGMTSPTGFQHGIITGQLPVVSDATQLAPLRAPTPTGAAPQLTTGAPSIVSAQHGPAARRSGMMVGAVVAGVGVLLGAFFWLTRTKSEPSAPPADSAAALARAAPVPSAAPSAAPKTCPERTVLIPAGQFFMGSDDKEAPENQRPVHNVTLDGFCMDLYEVTAREYRQCSDIGKCRRAPTEVEWPNITAADRKVYSPLCTISDPEKAEHPINCVTWDMANQFCKAQNKRLPTEAEWEYATRGPDGRVYPWGDEAPTAEHLNACGTECLAWARKNGVGHQFLGALYKADDGYPTTAPVGKFPAGRSRFGPYDVVGNVWEWVADWDGPYGATEQKNPTGPEAGQKRVIRGGAFNGSFPAWLHPSFRYAQDPKAQSYGIGFRCAATL